MAINLAVKYSKQIEQVYTLSSILQDKVDNEHEFTGVNEVVKIMPKTVDPVDYNRNGGTNRYGVVNEMQDTKQKFILAQDKGFTFSIDKGNSSEQLGLKNAAKMLKMQIEEKNVPMIDTYGFKRLVELAGTIVPLSSALTKANIISAIAEVTVVMDNNKTPQTNRFLAVDPTTYNMIRLAPEFLSVEALGEKTLVKGITGEVLGLKIVKVPRAYLPDDCYFVAWQKDAVMLPHTISDAKYHTDPMGVSGNVLEGRDRYDCFVYELKAFGVYAAVKTGTVTEKPTITMNGASATIATTTSGGVIRYTRDGSDPRYGASAVVYTGAVTLTAGERLNAYAEKSGMYRSGVTTTKYTG